MRQINHAIEEAANFTEFMRQASGRVEVGENGRQYVIGENREQRRRREQAERRMEKLERRLATELRRL